MSIHIIIDGYNLIRQSGVLSSLDRQDLQQGREALVEMLSAYKKMKPHRITVVFDGGNAPPLTPKRDRVKGIEILFSRQGELADALIKKIASKEREKALVVSSDRDVADFAAAMGCATINAQAFEDRISMAVLMEEKGIEDDESSRGWVPTTKKKGPSKRLTKRARRNRKKIGKL